jgi:hypothetical protein
MKANKIEQGKQYEITIGKNTTIVQVVEIEHRINGQTVFDCMNVKTNKRTTISDPKRFVRRSKRMTPNQSQLKPNPPRAAIKCQALRLLIKS